MQRKQWITLACGLVLACGAWFLTRSTPQQHPTVTATPASGSQTIVAKAADPIARLAAEEAHEDAMEALSNVAAPDALFQSETAHFAPPAMLGPDLFVSNLTMPELDASCATRLKKPDANIAIETQLADQFGVRGQQRVPDDLFFESLTQFYQHAGRYFQFSAVARTASRPPVYRVEFYSAADALMRSDAKRIDPPVGVPATLDAIGVQEILSQLLSQALAQGAVLGAREMQVRVHGGETQEDQQITYLNGRPVQWVFGAGLCQLGAKLDKSLCRCLPDGQQHVIP